LEELIENQPEEIYSLYDESTKEMLYEIEGSSVAFVGNRLLKNGFDVRDSFIAYL
jgi:hypothetical protein